MCRAKLRELAVCPRCGSDLTLALTARRQCDDELQSALSCAAQGRLQCAAEAARRASALRLTPLSRVLPGFIEHLEQQDTKAAAPRSASRTPTKTGLFSRLTTLYGRVIDRIGSRRP